MRFHEAINARDLDGLVDLMPPEHVFIDTAGSVTRGRDQVRKAWAGFFQAFPDYRNVVERVQARGNVVVTVGRSDCSVDVLDGPAIWRAVVDGGRVAEWRVYEDDERTRADLGVS